MNVPRALREQLEEEGLLEAFEAFPYIQQMAFMLQSSKASSDVDMRRLFREIRKAAGRGG